jgi:hypothetical protein
MAPAPFPSVLFLAEEVSVMRAKRNVVVVAVVCLIPLSILAETVPSRLFRGEGHGCATTYYYPDDDIRRITAVHDVLTPHIAWARPFHGGPLRVLAIAHRCQGRWPVELAERFDFHVTTVYGHDAQDVGSPPTMGMFVQGPADVQARLLAAMNEPIDVVVNDIMPRALGEAVLARLSGLLARGVGYVGPTEGLDLADRRPAIQDQRDLLDSTVPFAGLRALVKSYGSIEQAAGKALRLWTHDTLGRVADATAYPRDDAPPEPDRLQELSLISIEQEAWCALIGRAALWTARRLPARSSVPVEWPAEAIDREAMPYTLKATPPQGTRLQVRAWDADGRPRYEGRGPTIPPLPAGRYFVGVELFADRNAQDWTFGTVLAHSRVEIASLELDGTTKRPGETIRAKLMLSEEPPPGSLLRCEVIDNYGRSVWRQESAATRQASIEATFAESLHLYNYVNVQLVDGNGIMIAEDRRAFYIAQPGPPRDDLHWMVWEAGAQFHPNARILLKQFARLGMTGALCGEGGIPAATMVNAHAVVYAYRMTGTQVDRNGVTSPCFTSPGYRSFVLGELKKKVEQYRPYSPLFYYLGDDVGYIRPGQDACWSPTCRELLADWAKTKYRTIDKLNEAWGTAYGDFAQVEPIRQGEALAAVRKGSFGPLCHWIDHQLCTDAMVAGWWREMGRAIHEVAPDTPSNIGSMVVGWGSPGSGFDFWQIADGKDLVFQYPNPWVHDIFRCAARPDAFHGTWYGGYGLYNYKPYYDQDYLPWWSVFRGLNLHGLFYGGQDSPYYSMQLLGADLGPMEAVAKAFENIRELQAGPAKLLFNAKRKGDGIAIVYSPASVHASLVFGGGLPEAPEWQGQSSGSDSFIYMQCWEGLSDLIQDMGFSYDVIPASHLEEGRLGNENVRVLVLPLCLRLTHAEAETVRRFVRDGGNLIVDALPGLFDERCHVSPAGPLSDVLGMKRTDALLGTKISFQTAFTDDKQAMGSLAVDGGIKLTTARPHGKAADGTPILLLNTYGRGRALMLNALARDYQIQRALAVEVPLRDAVARLLAESAGLAPAIRCDVAAAGEKTPHRIQATEFHRYDLEGTEIVGLLRHPKLRPDDAVYMADLRPKPVWITFDRKSHVYDVRRGMYRGMTDRIEDVIYAGRAELYALMPYEVRGLTVRVLRKGPSIQLSAGIATGDPKVTPSTHVFHVEVIAPSGQPRPELTRNIVGKEGRLETDIFIGHNAEPGQWEVTVRDVASGLKRTVKMIVEWKH